MRRIFLDGQIREHAAPLRDERDAAGDDLVGRFAEQRLALKGDGAGFWLDKARDGLQRGGFACAVRADERDNLALLDGQVDALDGLNAAVGDDEALDLKILLIVVHPKYASMTR